MQGLADGYFVIPYTIGDYLATIVRLIKLRLTSPAFKETEKNVQAKINKLLSIKGTHPVDDLHKELGLTMWNYCGMARNAEGLQIAKQKIQA